MNNKENLIKAAKVSYVVVKILYIIACIACLAGLVLSIVLPITVKNADIPPMQFCATFIDMTLVAFFAIGILWNVEQWCKSIWKEGSPFTPKLPKYLVKMGVLTILASIVPAVVATAVIQSAIPDSDLVFNIGMGGVISGAILILGNVFFKYGAQLQKSEDETL